MIDLVLSSRLPTLGHLVADVSAVSSDHTPKEAVDRASLYPIVAPEQIEGIKQSGVEQQLRRR